MTRNRAAFEIITPITIGWHLKHIILGILFTGGIWLLTGYPLCLAGRRRANRVRVIDYRDSAAAPHYYPAAPVNVVVNVSTAADSYRPGQSGAWVA